MERLTAGELLGLMVAAMAVITGAPSRPSHEVGEQLQLPPGGIPGKRIVFGNSVPIPVDDPLRLGSVRNRTSALLISAKCGRDECRASAGAPRLLRRGPAAGGLRRP